LQLRLSELLGVRTGIAKAEPAGPGFVNVTLEAAVLLAQLPIILAAGEGYGQGADRAVNVEYVSANPTGPLHVGHCRGAVVGDALANLLAKAGYAVTKEYYVNDAGAQVIALGAVGLCAVSGGAGLVGGSLYFHRAGRDAVWRRVSAARGRGSG
jgi:arginyl-tRNA synthetase